MSETTSPEKSDATKSEWLNERRIKILATIVVPVVVAVIGLYKISGGGGGEKHTPNNFTLITDVSVIENQYLQITGHPLKDDNLKQLIQSAVNLAKAGQNEESRKLFEQVASAVPVPAVYTNLGSLNAEKGDFPAAHQAYVQALAKDADYKPALQSLQTLARIDRPTVTPVDAQEAEPNNDFNHVNLFKVGSKIAGAISDGTDNDFFQFSTTSGPRDYYQVALNNGSLTLDPSIRVYDANRQKVKECLSWESVAHVDCAFSALPESTYLVQIWGNVGTAGAYDFVVTPTKSYDSFEPNDDFPQAKAISLGNTIEANIMDGSDTDFYLLKTDSAGGQLSAKLDNDSTTLKPIVTVYGSNRQQVQNCTFWEPVAHVECAFAAQPQATYYVQVSGNVGTAGKYKLTVK